MRLTKQLSCNIALRLATLLTTLFCYTQPIYAEGSRDLYPSTQKLGARRNFLNVSSSSGAFNPFANKGVHKVYAKGGETILVGSSIVGKTKDGKTGSITIKHYEKDSIVASTRSSTIGLIQNRSQELLGPKRPGVNNGYTPLEYLIPQGQSGIYEVTFEAVGDGTNFNNAEVPVYNNWTQPLDDSDNGNSNGNAIGLIAAWDISVLNEAKTNLIPGRVYTTCLNLTGPNSIFNQPSFYGILYVSTPEGFIYQVDNNGQNGASFNFFSNNKGIKNNDGSKTYKSLNSSNTNDLNSKIWDPRKSDKNGDTTNKIFYNVPSADLPQSAKIHYTSENISTTTWLNKTPESPTIDNLVLNCNRIVSFNTNKVLNYELFIDNNGDNIFETTKTGNTIVGYNTIVLSVNEAPTNSNTKIKLRVGVGLAEVHFPLVDVESNKNGIIIKRLDPTTRTPIDTSDIIFWDDSNINHNTNTQNTNFQQTEKDNANNNGSNPRTQLQGISSRSNGHKWHGVNTGDKNYFGNNTTLDTWTSSYTEKEYSATISCSISGKVWLDNNGDANLNGGTEKPVSGNYNNNNNNQSAVTNSNIYANLVDNTDKVIASVQVQSDGTYVFNNTNTTGEYKIILTTEQKSNNTPLSTSNLPSNWVATGTNTNGIADTSNQTNIIIINKNPNTGDVINQNFGIEPLPIAGSGLYKTDNPGGTVQVTVPASTFTNTQNSTDELGGVVTKIFIPNFPAAAQSIIINGQTYTASNWPIDGIYIPTDANGNPNDAISVDPISNGITKITIPYLAIDNAGKKSANTGNAVIKFTIGIGGEVWNDPNADALKNAATELPISGTQDDNNNQSIVTSTGIYANLVNNNDEVVLSIPVNNDGSYYFTGIENSGNYKIILTDELKSANQTLTTATIPDNWVHTGTNINDQANTQNKSGIIPVTVNNTTSTQTYYDFGMQERPIAGSGNTVNINPNGNLTVTIPDNIFNNNTPCTDPNGGSITHIKIVEFPTNTDQLIINNTVYTPNNFPNTGILVPTDNTGKPLVPIEIDPSDVGISTVILNYKTVDNAGYESDNTGTVQIDLSVSISGNVWNDHNGDAVRNASNEMMIHGDMQTTPSGSTLPTGTTLYAHLLDNDNKVIASTTIGIDGTYSFNEITQTGTYKVVLSTETFATNEIVTDAKLPNQWVATGVNLQDVANQNNKSAIITVNIDGTTAIEQQNFGIEYKPIAQAKSFNVISTAFNKFNPGNNFPQVPGYSSIYMSSTHLTGYTSKGALAGSDLEDCANTEACQSGTGTTFNIETIKPNTKIYYDFGGSRGIEEINVNNGAVTIPNFDANNLVIYGKNHSGASDDPIGFTYSMTDRAGVKSNPVLYTIISDNPLPIELLYFNVKAEQGTSILNWATTKEKDNLGFVIQHSTDAQKWNIINTVASQSFDGNSEFILKYVYQHGNPAPGKNYYRLKQMNIDGTYSWSPIAEVWLNNIKEQIIVFPNPAKATLNIQSSLPIKAIAIYNIQGQKVQHEVVNNTTWNSVIDINQLNRGIYKIQIETESGNLFTDKLVKE